MHATFEPYVLVSERLNALSFFRAEATSDAGSLSDRRNLLEPERFLVRGNTERVAFGHLHNRKVKEKSSCQILWPRLSNVRLRC
jgi:hypothetical protein